MLLDSQGEGEGGPGEGEYIQPVEEEHQDWGDGGYSLWSVIPLQSNLLGPPQPLDSSIDWSGSGVCVWFGMARSLKIDRLCSAGLNQQAAVSEGSDSMLIFLMNW